LLKETIHPTPHPEVNAILGELLSGAKAILGDRFFAMYLYGSLSSGDFNPATSDIDFLVVTTGPLSAQTIAGLEKMHMDLKDGGLEWAKRLEGCYLVKDELRRHDPHHPPRPWINEGRFFMEGEGSDWVIQRHVLREQGLALAGPPPETLIDPVSPDDLRQSVLHILDEWWTPMLEKPDFLENGGVQAFAVLTMCRTLYTLEHGGIASKPVSARWAIAALDGRWRDLIERSLVMEHDSPTDILQDTLDFIGFTRDHAQRFERRAL
jgi:predicted nucleotidyltransferase